MQFHEVEAKVAALDTSQGFDLIYDLLRAYGYPAASITRLRKGGYNKATEANEVLWRDKVFYRYATDGDDIHASIDAASSDESIAKQRPRFLIVRDSEQIVAIDTRTGDTLDSRLANLPAHSAFFLPWAGIEKTQIENLNFADVKAAAKMARLYDEIMKANVVETAKEIHELNVFFSRLLFCFFAEDTGVFEKGSFTNAIGSFTHPSGQDVNELLDQIFDVLNTPMGQRIGYPTHLQTFGYVNGKLFERQTSAPGFTVKARSIVLECGSLDWSQINPDIFGSMMQAVVHPGERESLGMHYTSVENIMKVIRPLFLDELLAALDAADTKAKLNNLHQRIAAIKCFDPACGSGNFLVIAYKELRRLENDILGRLQEFDPQAPLALFQDSKIKLENFFGIEIGDFAHEIAILSLWLAKHQMNVEFKGLFGADIRLIPLRDTGNVTCGNSTRIDWNDACPKQPGDELYVLGNPPYLGSSMQTEQQKQDFVDFFGSSRYPKNLDYISLWFMIAARYIADGTGSVGFVSTNSVTQGDLVGLMWPTVLATGVDISFAYQSFKWANQARGAAGVTCVIIGLSKNPPRMRPLYSGGARRLLPSISPYLRPGKRDAIVRSQRTSIGRLPPMVFGSKPTDGGFLNFGPAERTQMLGRDPGLLGYIRRYMGAKELISGSVRYCFWISEEEAEEALSHPDIAQRTDDVTAMRLRGSTVAQAMADRPYRFLQRAHRDGTAIIVPRHSSERREYIPMAFVDDSTVIADSCNAIYGAEVWLFALLTSRAHNVWVRAVCGRIKTDFRYSATLCYNTFPVPVLTVKQHAHLSERAFGVLEARENHSEMTLAQMYDPEKMPGDLRQAHQFLDVTVDQFYRKRPFESDDERLELLFDMYEAAISGDLEPVAELEPADA